MSFEEWGEEASQLKGVIVLADFLGENRQYPTDINDQVYLKQPHS